MPLTFRRPRNRPLQDTIWSPSTEVACLRFSPTSWAKLLYLRDRGPTEVGGFAISGKEELLQVEEIQLVKQSCTEVSVAFDNEAVADFFNRQVDRGLKPEQFARIWLHTHPGNCPLPSGKDEETFARVFGRSDWALMFILARGGQTYARLQFSTGPGAQIEVSTQVEYQREFSASDWPSWQQEYTDNVRLLERNSRVEPLAAWEDEFLSSSPDWQDGPGLPAEVRLSAPF